MLITRMQHVADICIYANSLEGYAGVANKLVDLQHCCEFSCFYMQLLLISVINMLCLCYNVNHDNYLSNECW